jgi:hypothetical protein
LAVLKQLLAQADSRLAAAIAKADPTDASDQAKSQDGSLQSSSPKHAEDPLKPEDETNLAAEDEEEEPDGLDAFANLSSNESGRRYKVVSLSSDLAAIAMKADSRGDMAKALKEMLSAFQSLESETSRETSAKSDHDSPDHDSPDHDSPDHDSPDHDSQHKTPEDRGVSNSSGDSQAADDDEAIPDKLDPSDIFKQHIFLERAIRDVLRAISETANYILQQAQIVPDIPKPVLAAAAESDSLVQTPMKTPNLLKISIKAFQKAAEDEDAEDMDEDDEDIDDEADEDEEEEDNRASFNPLQRLRIIEIEDLSQMIVIHLRLSEIEFADPDVAALRSRLREKLSQLKQLGMAYQKTQRELAMAKADESWRSNWVED